MLDKEIIEKLCLYVRKAGRRTLEIREQDRMGTRAKEDGSPVTQADHDSQAIIFEGLLALTPNIPIIAEEQDNDAIIAQGHRNYWLLDPLDGTRDFIAGRDDYAVSLGLIHQGEPAFGFIYTPARDDLTFGGPSFGAFREKGGQKTPLKPPVPTLPPRLAMSRRDVKVSPTEAWLASGAIREILICASATKLALLAAGEVDLFYRVGPTYEWDTAAGDAIVRALGGTLLTPDGQPLRYQKPELKNGPFLACCQDRAPLTTFVEKAALSHVF